MNCNEASAKFDAFFEDRLSARETEAFIKHINSCPECKDELEVLYMVRYTTGGIFGASIDDTENYDLRNLLSAKILERERYVKRHKRLQLLILLSILAVIALLLLWFIYAPIY